MVTARQSRNEIRLAEPMVGVAVAYDGAERVAAKTHSEETDAAYRRGYDEASAQYNQQILDFRSEVNALREGTFSALEARFGSILKEARGALVTLTHDCVSRILGGIELTPEIALSVVNALIEEAGLNEERMEIRLHPSDLELLVEFESDLKRTHPGLEFLEDASLSRGDCLLNSRFGKVDGLISTKLDRLRDGLSPE